MEKDFVPYELAVKLKALGFDEPCLTCYDKLEMVASHSKNVFDYKNYNTSGYMVSRATFQQAFRWFRNKYGVHSSPRKYDETQWWVEWGIWTSSIGTFEEAEIAWLTKLIELTEIIETRTK